MPLPRPDTDSKQYGVNVPVNSTILDMIHEIELKRRGISVDNFNDPDFSGYI